MQKVHTLAAIPAQPTGKEPRDRLPCWRLRRWSLLSIGFQSQLPHAVVMGLSGVAAGSKLLSEHPEDDRD